MQTLSPVLRQHHDVEHLSEEWFALRVGKITSSCAGNLLTNGRGTGTVGQTFYSYVCELVENEMFGEEESFENADTLRGQELEPIAFNEFRQKMAMDFIEVTKCGFFTLGEHEGSSPDGLVGEDAILEIKAPRRRKFFDILKNGVSAVDKSWLEQVQHQLRVTDRSIGYLLFIFVSDDGVPYTHHIVLGKDPAIQEKLEDRVNLAIEEKLKYRAFLESAL